MAGHLKHEGSFEALAQAESYVDEPGAYLDVDTAGGYAQVGAKGPGTLGLKLRTIVAGVVATVMTFTAAGAGTMIGGLTLGGNVNISPGTATNAAYTVLVNTGGAYYFGVENSVGSIFGATAYSMVLYTPAGLAIEINKTTNTIKARSLVAAVDNTYDIGASGANRFRDLFLSRNIVNGGTITSTGLITANAGVTATLSSAAPLVVNRTGTDGTIGQFSMGGVGVFSVAYNVVTSGVALVAGAATNPVMLSNFGSYGFLTFNSLADTTTGMGIFGRVNASEGMYYQTPTGTAHRFTVANELSMSIEGGGVVGIVGTAPRMYIYDTNGTVNSRRFDWTVSTNTLDLEARNDAVGFIRAIFSIPHTSGNILSVGLNAITDNTYDIGASGVNRFRDLFLSRNIVAGGKIRLDDGGSDANPAFQYVTTGSGLSFPSTTEMRLSVAGVARLNIANRIDTFGSVAGAYLLYSRHSNANPLGFLVEYTGAVPNDTAHEFYQAGDTSAIRFAVRGNGGIANFSANNVNLSDERVKDMGDSIDGKIASQIVRQANFRLYKYKDQTHDDWNIGLGAREFYGVVKSTPYADSLVDRGGWRGKNGDKLWSLHEADLMYVMAAALKDALIEIETLKNKVA